MRVIHYCVAEDCSCLDRGGVVAYEGPNAEEARYWMENVPAGYVARDESGLEKKIREIFPVLEGIAVGTWEYEETADEIRFAVSGGSVSFDALSKLAQLAGSEDIRFRPARVGCPTCGEERENWIVVRRK